MGSPHPSFPPNICKNFSSLRTIIPILRFTQRREAFERHMAPNFRSRPPELRSPVWGGNPLPIGSPQLGERFPFCVSSLLRFANWRSQQMPLARTKRQGWQNSDWPSSFCNTWPMATVELCVWYMSITVAKYGYAA